MSEETNPSKRRRTRAGSKNAKAPKRMRLGCLKKFFLASLIALLVLGFLVNGPVFRWATAFAIKKGAESAGLSGDLSVKGTLLSGIGLKDVSFRGDGTGVVDSLVIAKAGVNYSIVELIKSGGLGWIDEIRFSDVDIDIVLKDSPEKERAEKNPEKEESAKKDQNALWELLETRMTLENVNVQVTQKDSVYRINGLSLILPDGGVGKLAIDRLAIPGARPREDITTDILVTPGSLTLGPLQIVDAVGITSMTLEQVAEPEPFLGAVLDLSGGVVEVSYRAHGNITAELTEGAISMPELLALAQVEGLNSGSIDKLDIQFGGDFGEPASWESDISLKLRDLEWGKARVDDVTLTGRLVPGDSKPEVLQLAMVRGEASIDALANVDLSQVDSLADIALLPLRIDAQIAVESVEPLLADFLDDAPEKVPAKGSLAGHLTMHLAQKKLVSIDADIDSQTLSYDGVAVDSISMVANLKRPDPVAIDADIALDEETSIKAKGTIDPDTLAYAGSAEMRVVANERSKALLSAFGFSKELEANAALEWTGEGNLEKRSHQGSAKVTAAGIQIDGAQPFDVRLGGKYDDLNIDLNELVVTSEQLQLDGELSYHDGVLDVSGFRFHSEELLLAEGRLRVPLNPSVLSSPEDFFAQNGEVDVDIESNDLALESILGLFHQEPPVNCRIGLALQASGPPGKLDLTGSFSAEDLTVPGTKVAPAQANLDLSVKGAVASITGRVEQPQIEPFKIDGTMPFHPKAWVEGSRDPTAEPLSLAARMNKSQLAFLADYTPAIEGIEGAADIDLALSGTLSQPSLVGHANLGVDAIQFTSSSAPSVRNFEMALRFEEQVLHVDEFKAVIAGGIVGVGGSITFPRITHPELDLRLGGHEVLVHRSGSTSVRTDLDVGLKGPLPTASLYGTIGITNSLFYKNIDILPVGNVGRGGGKSVVPEVEAAPKMPLPKSLDIGVPIEPFRNWPVDLRIITVNPFRIAGNIANANVACDLSLGGTLGSPVPNGRIWTPDGRVTLPFSRIELTEAEVFFDENSGFNGRLAVRGDSKVGDYRVSIFGQNRILAPRIIFNSIPHLPREDILSLLASGVTRQQLTSGGGGTAATKAAILWLKSLSNQEATFDPDAPPTFAETLEERTEVSVGRVDPDSGEMGINASIRLWRQSFLAFGFGKEGSQRGVLKYIFRFR